MNDFWGLFRWDPVTVRVLQKTGPFKYEEGVWKEQCHSGLIIYAVVPKRTGDPHDSITHI